MKTITVAVAAAALLAGVMTASAQVAQTAPSTLESLLPFANSGVVYSGRSAYVGGARTDRTYGIGVDGQGVLAPHINNIF